MHQTGQETRVPFNNMIGCDYMADMVIENYRTTDTIGEAKEIIRKVDQKVTGRPELMQKLKLKTLIKSENAAMRVQSARLLWPELVPHGMMASQRGSFDLDVWGKFLPTAHQLENYSFDAVPLDALQHVEAAADLKVFDRIEIWTPEGNSAAGRIQRMRWQSSLFGMLVDSMAVGVITTGDSVLHYFSIARWGESLDSFENIKAYVKRVDREIVLRRLVVPVLITLFGIALVTLIAFNPSWGEGNQVAMAMPMLVAFAVVALAGGIGLIVYRTRSERFFSLGSQYHSLRGWFSS